VVKWNSFTPSDFEYDFENDKLAAHQVTFDEAVECFFSDFQVRKNKKFKDRYQLIGTTLGGRRLKIIFQLKRGDVVRVITGWVAVMNSRKKQTKRQLSEKEVDKIVESQADDDSAWGKPIGVRRSSSESLALPAELATRAAFIAKLHREKNVKDWLTRVIRERVELEEVAFSEAKREISLRNGV
jgi:uncharacterized DUF497 family protein